MGDLADRLWRLALRVAHGLQLACWFVLRPRQRSAHVAVWWEGRLLLVRNSYRRGLSLPAGRARRGEPPARAACRELLEEVGVAVEPEALRSFGIVENRDELKTDVAHVFEIELIRPPRVVVDRREVIWAGFTTPEEARRERLSTPARTVLDRRAGPSAAAPPAPPAPDP